jgi:D-alanyl-D-alanine carboxypeptidase (penicillin-binding protein 5/6)
MKRFFASLFLVALPFSAVAQFQTDAPQAVIIDHETGLVLFEKNAREPLPPASMTKIMTAHLVFEALAAGDVSEDTEFTVSEEAWRRGGAASGSSTMFLDVGSSVPVIDLLRGVIIQSGNDACITLAEGLAGSEDAFARRMTDRARAMGLDSATFRNATGWPDEGHEISTLDLAKLASALIKTFPDRYALYAERSFTWNDITQSNRNPLLGRFTGADGVKTGSTSVSGYGLVGSALRDGARRTIVINGLGSQSERRTVALEIMNAAFRDFDVLNLFQSGDQMGEIPVYMGQAEAVSVVLRDNIQLGVHRNERDAVTAKIDYRVAPAPVAAGDKVAELVILKSETEVGRYPLYAEASIARKGFFGRAGAALLQKIRGE